jgi:hypothetical protein
VAIGSFPPIADIRGLGLLPTHCGHWRASAFAIADNPNSGNVHSMDRRTLLMLAACLPALSASRAAACSPALKNPRNSGLENQQVRELFEAWWDRDVDKFRSYFTQRLMADGTPMEPNLAAELMAGDPVPPKAFDIFDKFFIDKSKISRITLIVNTMAAILVACEEADLHLNIQSDCTGMPRLHLFAVTMSGLNPRSITHIATTETPVTDKFGIWFAGSV